MFMDTSGEEDHKNIIKQSPLRQRRTAGVQAGLKKRLTLFTNTDIFIGNFGGMK